MIAREKHFLGIDFYFYTCKIFAFYYQRYTFVEIVVKHNLFKGFTDLEYQQTQKIVIYVKVNKINKKVNCN